MEIGGLVAGLGNPGKRYLHTRHNCGFSFVEALLSASQKILQIDDLGGQKFNCRLWRLYLENVYAPWLCACPLTYMNESGQSLHSLLSWYKLNVEQMVVVHDELDLPCGIVRFKFGGGNAGHNGLRSIEQYTGSKDFYRLRIGIGKPGNKDEILNWVLGKPPVNELERISHSFKIGVNIFYTFCISGFQAAVKLARDLEKNETKI